MRRKAAHTHDIRVSLVASDDAQLIPDGKVGVEGDGMIISPRNRDA